MLFLLTDVKIMFLCIAKSSFLSSFHSEKVENILQISILENREEEVPPISVCPSTPLVLISLDRQHLKHLSSG